LLDDFSMLDQFFQLCDALKVLPSHHPREIIKQSQDSDEKNSLTIKTESVAVNSRSEETEETEYESNTIFFDEEYLNQFEPKHIKYENQAIYQVVDEEVLPSDSGAQEFLETSKKFQTTKEFPIIKKQMKHSCTTIISLKAEQERYFI
jgi:hypothetical protein